MRWALALLALCACRRDPRHRPDAAVAPMLAAAPGSLAGGKVTIVVALDVAAPVLAVDDRSLYWMDQHSGGLARVMKMPKDGWPAVSVMASSTLWLPQLAVNQSSVFVAEDGVITRADKARGMVVFPELVPTASPFVAASDTTLFWTESAGVRSMPLPRGPIETVWSSEWGAFSPVVAGEAIYWASGRGDHESELWGREPGQPAALLAKDHGEASVLAVDGDWLYWLTERSTGNPLLDGELWRVPRAGGSAAVLAQGGFMHELAVWNGLVYLARFNAPDHVEVVELDGKQEHVLLRSAQTPEALVRDATGLYVVLGSPGQQGQIVRISR